MPWYDLDEGFYNGTLPNHIKHLRESLINVNDDLTGIRVCKDPSTALTLLDFSNRIYPNNELIIVASEKLAEIKGTIDLDVSKYIHMGYDLISLGNWSLLRDGLFRSPPSFPKSKDSINKYGLIASPHLSRYFIDDYMTAVKEGKVEELPESPYGIDVIEIGKPIEEILY